MPEPPGADLHRVLAAIAARNDCQLLPPAGPARVPDGVALPHDVSRFHERCGGAVLFIGTEFPWQVGVPDRVVAASPRLLTPEIATRVAVENPEDLTNECYVIADGGRESSTDANIVVDLHPDRLGRCYVAFWDTYGVVGEMPIVALTMAELLRALLEHDGRAASLPDRYGDAYEPRLPWQPKQIVELDTEWLGQWRDDITDAIASVMPMFEERMGYAPGDNWVGRPLDGIRLTEITEMGQLLPPDLALFSRLVGELSLPDVGNGWFVLNPLYRARIGPPYNVDIVLFASDGGGTTYALPVGKAGPVLRIQEVGETAPGVFDGERIEVCAPHLRAFLAGLRDAVRLFASTGGTADP
jgi:antitoxin YokJ